MPDFNTKAGLGPEDAPSYLNALRGKSSGLEPFAELFKGVGNVAMQAVAVADQNNISTQKSLIEKGVSSALNDFGFRTEGNSETNTPSELIGYKKQLDAVHKAYLSGSLKDSAFQMRIDALSRQVRSRYPGYDSEIDTVINQTLNRSTANDLRKQMSQEWDHEMTQQSAESRALQTDLDAWQKDGVLQQAFPDYYQRVAKGTEPSPVELRAKIGTIYADRANLEQSKKALEYEDAQGTSTKKKRLDTAYSDIAQVSRTVLDSGLTSPAVKDFLSGLGTKTATEWTDKELQGGLAALEPLLLSAKQQMLKRLSDPLYDKLTKQERDDVVVKGMEPLQAAKDAVLAKDTGLLNVFKTLTDTQIAKDAHNFYMIGGEKGDPSAIFARKRNLVKSVFGDTALTILDTSPEGLKANQEASASILKMEFAKEGVPLVSILEDGKKASDEGVNGAVTNNLLTSAVKLVTDPTVKPEGKARAVDMLFSEGNASFLSKFSDKVTTKSGKSDRMVAFEKLTSPEVSAAIKQASLTNPELADKYKNSMATAFNSLFKKDIANVVDVTKFSDYVSIIFDPETLQFKPIYKGEKQSVFGYATMASTPVGALYSLNEQWKASSGLKSLNDMNGYLRNFKPAMDAVGVDPKEALTELFQANGVTGVKEEGSLFTKLYNAFTDGSVGQAAGKSISGMKNSPSFAPDNTHIFDSPDKFTTLRDFIGNAEGADYNTLNGGRKLPLTEMSIGEAKHMAEYNKKIGGGSTTAVGKYQVLTETLNRAMKGLGLTDSATFDAKTQDKIANWLIENEAGGGKDAKKLAAVWASLPQDESGKSVYEGDKNGNKARVSYEELLKNLIP